ncbi:MAG: type III-B CRISPR module RAMP protein Cmr4 [Dictyoglomus sp.]|nr:type III-B CRISPR module RAMP protein Cmr4 [Dictyoglomus sp.]MCX7942576.1 type III-B CRISPR module RAMP protein Cmr4 [Dictyoglomaceae bacterium]MDW8188814.1 type III-B CRISPR module RAMP protein Cmr4 [Dictyoglomus sp.]
MFREKRLLFLITETPLHAGSGSEVGIVDLPIQRERYTDFPKIESSGLKGCIREAFEGYRIFENNESKLINNPKVNELLEDFPQLQESWVIQQDKERQQKTDKNGNKLIKFDEALYLLFGPEDEEAYAGAITITDARILLFPVKSLKGIFAWITCPMVLERFKKDLEIIGVESFRFNNFNNFVNTLPKESNIKISSKIVLEEFTFDVKEDETTRNIAEWFSERIFPNENSYKFWREKIKKDLVILSDDDFRQFTKTSTEVITRTKIDDKTGTVLSGALWTEEYLPQDTILYTLIMFTPTRVEKEDQKGVFRANSPQNEVELVCKFFEKGLPEVIQIGGNQTIGKGFVRTNILRKEV